MADEVDQSSAGDKKPVFKPLPDASPTSAVNNWLPVWMKPYAQLARIDRPIGWWLLLLPCWWSSAMASMSGGQALHFKHLALFLIGAIVMRGAGSTWNDILDRDLDREVERTRARPLPAGMITTKQAAIFLALQCIIGLAVLLSFNNFSIILGFLSLVPVIIYPLMKRITSHPQLVLGLAFAWGALMGWAAIFNSLSLAPLLLYGGAIVWTIGYDTIYALQDLEDDAIIGICSTARAYGAKAPQFIGFCYLTSIWLIMAALFAAGTGIAALVGLLGFACHLVWQARRVRVDDPQGALMLFRSNRSAGLMLFAGLAMDTTLHAGLLS